MVNIDTDLITAAIERGEEFTILDISKKMLSYIRVWANRKGLHVAKIDGDAIISKTKYDKLRTEIYRNLPRGQMFLVVVPASRRGYLRNLISIYNKTAQIKYKTNVVTNPPPKEDTYHYIIYPAPTISQQLSNIPNTPL